MAEDQNARIAALATPWGSSAIAVIRTSGAGTIESIGQLFRPAGRLEEAAGNTVHHGRILHPATREVLDEVMVALYRAPRSYTGEDAVEIMCHGSVAGIERIMGALFDAGFRQAEPGEFTLRAFLAGKLDLTRAEAVREIVNAQTGEAHAMALQRLAGALEERINEVKGRLVTLLAAVDIQLDYPEEETGEIVIAPEVVVEAQDRIRALLAGYRTGRIYQEGARVAIAGRTNAGKSSLFNALLRQDRSIVSEKAGTTRDYIESAVSVSGVPLRLFDTAGFRESSEDIESEGIRRSQAMLAAADLVLYVVDATCGPTEAEQLVVEELRSAGRLVGVWNKVDLLDPAAFSGDHAAARGNHAAAPLPAPAPPPGFVPVSVTTGAGIEALLDEIGRRVLPDSLAWRGEPVIDSLRQKQLLETALEALGHVLEGLAEGVPADAVALDVEEALRALGEITGEVTTDEVLDAMFSGFCVGK